MRTKWQLTISISLYFLFFVNIISGTAQNNKVKLYDYLSPLENEIVKEINFARKNPQKYASFLVQLKQYYVGKLIQRQGEATIITNEGVSAVDEAIRFLNAAKSIPSIRCSKGMSLAAKDHVEAQGPTGAIGHKDQNGSQPWDRVNRYGTWQKRIGENISYGRDNARDIVMGLIIDDGVPDRGHRKNIFNSEFRVVGVAYGYHATYRSVCVINFAGGFIEKRK